MNLYSPLAIVLLATLASPLHPAADVASQAASPAQPLPAMPLQKAEATTPPAPVSNVSLTPPTGTAHPSTASLGTQSKEEQAADIYLNFNNVSLANVVNYLGEMKKVNIVPLKDLESRQVSLTTHMPLTLDRAWNVLLTLLDMNGYSMVQVNALYRIVPNGNTGQQPLPCYSSGTGIQPEDLPDSDVVIRYVYFLKNIKLDIAKNILNKMIDDSNVTGNPDLNVCIVKDKSFNIKAAFKIVKELDLGGLREAIEIIPLTWANADNVQKLFVDITGSSDADNKTLRFTSFSSPKESVYFSSDTKIIAEPIKNNLILLGTKESIGRIKNFVYKYIDRPIDDAESRLHVKELKYIKAQDIKPIIDKMVMPPQGTADKAMVLEGGYKVFEDVMTTAESDDSGGGDAKARYGVGNRLIVACNRDDWIRLEDFIDKLDKPQPQVGIEVMILDITIDDDRQLGANLFNFPDGGKEFAPNVNIEFANLSGNAPKGKNSTPVTGSSTAATPNSNTKKYIDALGNSYINIANGAPGSPTFITLGQAATPTTPMPNQNNNIWGIIQAILNTSNSQVIAQPYILANNNQAGLVKFESILTVAGKMDASKSITAVVTNEDLTADVSVTITPHINLLGIIDMNIDVSVQSFTPGQSPNTPDKSNRTLTTKATMATGEVLVIGGLTSDSMKESLQATPLLSKIPIIGSLFKQKARERTKTNLYVFMRPSIIKPSFEGAPDEYTQLKLDYAKYQVMKNDSYAADTDPVQRWYFKPDGQSVKDKISDAARGVYRPIDDYTYGKTRPKAVDIHEDPYFTVSEAIAKDKRKRGVAAFNQIDDTSLKVLPAGAVAG